jgi:hypothetical protein
MPVECLVAGTKTAAFVYFLYAFGVPEFCSESSDLCGGLTRCVRSIGRVAGFQAAFHHLRFSPFHHPRCCSPFAPSGIPIQSCRTLAAGHHRSVKYCGLPALPDIVFTCSFRTVAFVFWFRPFALLAVAPASCLVRGFVPIGGCAGR